MFSIFEQEIIDSRMIPCHLCKSLGLDQLNAKIPFVLRRKIEEKFPDGKIWVYLRNHDKDYFRWY